MIYARPQEPFEALLMGAPSGLLDTLEIEVYDPTAPATGIVFEIAGVVEVRPGTYRATVTLAAAGTLMIRWGWPPDYRAEEELTVSGQIPVAPPPGLPAWAPTREEVADLLVTRTRPGTLVGGYEGPGEVGTFNDATRPTGEQVDRLIRTATLDTEDRIGAAIPDHLHDDAGRLAALRAAVLLEVSYHPQQVAADASPQRQYQAAYLDGTERLRARVTGATVRLA